MLLADAKLQCQPVRDLLAPLMDQLRRTEQYLLTLIAGELRLAGRGNLERVACMLGCACRDRADHLVGLRVTHLDHLVGVNRLAADTHAFGADILLSHLIMFRARLLRGRHRGVKESVKIAKVRCVRQIDPTVHDERHLLLGKAAMAAKRFFQRGKVMPVF